MATRATTKKPAPAPKKAAGAAGNRRSRPDRNGPHRMQFEANRKIIMATRSVCAICGQPVDKTLKSPHPMSATVDHIIPIARNGHPSDISNLQLAHRACNRAKSDKIAGSKGQENETETNRCLPQSHDWKTF